MVLGIHLRVNFLQQLVYHIKTLGLIIEAAPKAIKEGVNKAEAEKIKAQIEAAGGTVELK